MKLVNYIKELFDAKAYGVCEWWGTRFNVSTNAIRVYFIYLSFLTLGSPLVVYLAMAFILKNKSWFKPKKNTIWEL